MVVVGDGDDKYYMDNHLYKQLGKVRGAVEKDDDYVLLVTGQEGAGKSVFSMQVAKRLDPNFSIGNVCFTPDEFERAVMNAGKGECIVYDEA